MKKLLVCTLALCAVLLAACGHPAKTLPPEGGDPVVSPAPDPSEITGQLAAYTGGNVDVALTIPDGWSWETLEEDGQAGLRFWRTEDTAVDFRLTCWKDGYGICGTGVTTEGVMLSSGQQAWQHTEVFGDNIWVNIAFVFTPGDYVCMPFDDGMMDKAAWDGCRDEVLAILGTAQIGRGLLTEQEAIALAQAQYDGAYDTAWGRYDVKNGCWAVTFSKGTAGGGNAVVRYVGNDGTVSDQECRMCIEGEYDAADTADLKNKP